MEVLRDLERMGGQSRRRIRQYRHVKTSPLQTALLCVCMMIGHSIVCAEAKSLDFFFFVLEWPGSYCDTKTSCCYPITGKPAADFQIHGLWPNYEDGSYPFYCDPKNPFDPSQISDLIMQMRSKWGSLACPSSDGEEFWAHEWNKHGTCAESTLNQHAYFQAALCLRQKVDLLDALVKEGIRPTGKKYKAKRITDALKTYLGHTPCLQCNKDARGNAQLYQIFICVARDASTLINCPIFSKSCNCPRAIRFPRFEKKTQLLSFLPDSASDQLLQY